MWQESDWESDIVLNEPKEARYIGQLVCHCLVRKAKKRQRLLTRRV